MVAFNPILWRAFDPDGNAHDYCRRPENVATEVAWATEDGRATIHHGDCLDVMRSMPDGSVDAVVCDPPYGLEFMGKDWDRLDGEAWRTGGAFTKPGIGDRATAWPSYGSGDTANATCATCGGRMRGAKRCECAAPEWRVKGKPIGESKADTRQSQGVKMQEWHRLWAIEALRVAKPGAHLLAFGGTRTFHRLTCAIEDAGWEIRDCLSYLYGSGFPKSHNIGCRCEPVSYDHAESGPERDVRFVPRSDVPTAEHPSDERGEVLFSGVSKQGAPAHRAACDEPEDARREQPRMEGRGDAQEAEGELLGRALRQSPGVGASDGASGRVHHGASAGDGDRVGPVAGSDGSRASPESPALGQSTGEPRTVRVERGAQEGRGDRCEKCGGLISARGLGTALKPAWEPVILARKPLIGTVAANHAAHGTGALNIDGCRIATTDSYSYPNGPGGNLAPTSLGMRKDGTSSLRRDEPVESHPLGRWPANVLLDEDAARALDEQSGVSESVIAERVERSNGVLKHGGENSRPSHGTSVRATEGEGYADFGGASRFFYTAKASRSEREAGLTGAKSLDGGVWGGAEDDLTEGKKRTVARANTHPTVKPVDLMRWLVRLVTPLGGTVLDPFLGSGTTLVAALQEGCRAIGIEREAPYVEIAKARVAHEAAQGSLFK